MLKQRWFIEVSDAWELGTISAAGLTEAAQTAALHSCVWTVVYVYQQTISSKHI